MSFRTLWFEDGALHLLDQRGLPERAEIVKARTAGEVAQAIREMVVRGAPAIGCAAAYGLALSAGDFEEAATGQRRASTRLFRALTLILFHDSLFPSFRTRVTEQP